jgi:probable HAF family extracellular repeat protein
MKRFTIIPVLLGLLFFVNVHHAHGQRLIWLGTLGGDRSEAYDVSADGRFVVGYSYDASGRQRAFRWDAQTGQMLDLGTLGGTASVARRVSADGSVVVGQAENASGQGRAFRWMNGTMQDLGTFGGPDSYANSVSADGSIVVGLARNPYGEDRAFRWVNGVMQEIGTLGGTRSGASDVSPDGRFVVGYARDFSETRYPFIWDAQTGQMQNLNAGSWGNAIAVSADGSVAVGHSDFDSRAFRWVNGSVQWLGTLGGSNSRAADVTADGSVVVGRAQNANGQWRAFRWTAQSGMQDLNQLYATLLQVGSYLEVAIGISPDGRYIVGYGYNAATGRWEAFLLYDSLLTSSVSERNVLPEQFVLYQNYPNPFNPSTTIRFALPERSHVTLKVFDILGNEMATLVNWELNPGEHSLIFDAKGLPSGVYFYQIQVDRFVQQRKMVVLK